MKERMKMKKFCALSVALTMISGGMCAEANEEKFEKVFINGEETAVNAVEGYIPVRSFADAIGAKVSWDNDRRCVVIDDGGEVVIPIGQKWVQRDGLKKSVEKESVIREELSYMPYEALKAFNAEYEQTERGIEIEASVFDGKYVKISVGGKLLSSDNGICVGDVADGENALWEFTGRGANVYRLRNKKTQKAIDVPGDSKEAGKTLIEYAITGGGNQNYVIERNEDGTYFIKCFNSGLYMTAGEDGSITQEEKTGRDNQRFVLECVETKKTESADAEIAESPQDLYDGKYVTENGEVYGVICVGEKYEITNVKTGEVGKFDLENTTEATLDDMNYAESSFAGGKVVELAMGDNCLAVDESTNEIVLVPRGEAGDAAIWNAVAVQEDGVSFVNKRSKQAIDVPNESREAGIKLSQYASNRKNHQVYAFEKADGGVRLKNKNSGMYITIKDKIAYQDEKSNEGQIFECVVRGESDEKTIAVTATPFVLKGDESVTNVKLQWNEVAGAKRYDVFRQTDDGELVLINSLNGFTVDDYDLEIGKKYTYRVYASDSEGVRGYAQTEAFEPFEMPLDMKSATNLEPSSMSLPGGGMCDADGVYYKFAQRSRTDGEKGFGEVTMATSVDGINYTDPVVIMTIDDILAHETCKDIEDIRFESVNFKYNPKANNFGFVAHAEKGSGGYGFARISIATYTPGDEKMVFHGAVRPNGDDVRDLNTFIDDDGTGYIMGATHNNADLAIYKLSDDWSKIEERVALINKGKWRELPNILKVDGYYYLFTSGCAGWYPTPGMYNSAKSMDGEWSELRSAGNQTTFSSQSGYCFCLKKDSKNYVMNSYRWMGNWKDATVKTTQSLRLPVKVSDGYAFYDYFEELLYNGESDVLVPVQRGRILSQNRPTDYGKNANDGNYKSQWTVDTKWPYSWEVDLGSNRTVSQVQISWRIHNGSEAYYNYIVEGSEDGESYSMLADNSDGYTDYGFTVDNCSGKARFVRVTVLDAKPRSGDNDYPSSFYEIKVLGR